MGPPYAADRFPVGRDEPAPREVIFASRRRLAIIIHGA